MRATVPVRAPCSLSASSRRAWRSKAVTARRHHHQARERRHLPGPARVEGGTIGRAGTAAATFSFGRVEAEAAMRLAWLGCSVAFLACGVPPESPTDEAAVSTEALLAQDARPDGKGGGLADTPATAAARPRSGTNGIAYHGGPVLHGDAPTSTSSGTAPGPRPAPRRALLDAFASTIGGSPYYGINTTYIDRAGPVANAVGLRRPTTDRLARLVVRLRHRGHRAPTPSPRGACRRTRTPSITSSPHADVAETSGFCTSYCGWHTHATLSRAWR